MDPKNHVALPHSSPTWLCDFKLGNCACVIQQSSELKPHISGKWHSIGAQGKVLHLLVQAELRAALGGSAKERIN